MPFTEFCCRSGGSNLNAGTRTGDSTEPGVLPVFTYASGSWVAATGVFTVAAGNPLTDGVAVGDFASVYADGSTVTGFVGRVTARTSTTITVSLTARMGAAPTDGTSNRTLRIGGAWQGPSGSSTFPFSLASWSAATNANGSATRINLKNDQTYSITTGISVAVDGGMIQGYGSLYGDGSRATIDGGTSAIDVVSLTRSTSFGDCVVRNNAASGTNRGVTISGSGNASPIIFNVVASGHRDAGFRVIRQAVLIECEAFGNCTSNSASGAGFQCSFGTFVRCISHDNTGSNSAGFAVTASAGLVSCFDCIADTNGGNGFLCNPNSTMCLVNCSAYNNAGDAFRNDGAGGTNYGSMYVENSIATRSGQFGHRYGLFGSLIGVINSTAYGSGTEANTSGQTSIAAAAGVIETGAVTLASNISPFTDAPNGDFRKAVAAVRNTGRGSWVQTAPSYSGTVSYPDIGAAQSQGGSGGSGLILPRPMNGGYSA